MVNHSSGGDYRDGSPPVDQRQTAALIEQMKRLAPYYTPEWRFRPEDPDPGTALFLMFSKLLEGNIRRLNQVPYKSFLTFLNRFDVSVLPARSALAQIQFVPTERAGEPIYVPPGTQLSAVVPGEPDPIIFETARSLLVTTAKLMDLFSVSPKRDSIIRLAGGNKKIEPGESGRGVEFFGREGTNEQEHVVYFKHDYLFLLKSPAYIEINVKNTRNEFFVREAVRWLSDREAVEWEYFSEGAWTPFDRVSGSSPVLRLVKRKRKPITTTELFGEDGYWIRCRARSLHESEGTPQLGSVQIDMLTMKSDFLPVKPGDGIVPDRLYFNDIQVEPDEFQPFGDFFAPYGLFYVAGKETLSKRGSNIKLQFRLNYRLHRLLPDKPPQINWKPIMKREEVDKTEIPDPVSIARVLWEYWNGRAWVRLPVSAEAQRMFHKPYEGTQPREIEFKCPEDLEETVVNAESNYWIRGRIVSVENAYSPNAVYYSPNIERLRMQFQYDEPEIAPQRMIVRNNLTDVDRTRDVQTGGFSFRPFEKLEGSQPALCFGFDTPPERGPISLYFSLRGRRTAAQDVPPIEWEYLKRLGGSYTWAPLAAADETAGFTISGAVQFAGAPDFASAHLFGVQRYWIRAVNRDGRLDDPERRELAPRALKLMTNTVLAVQQETLRAELPRREELYDNLEERTAVQYVLANQPVLTEEVWVNETGYMSEEEALRLKQSGHGIETVADDSGELMSVWVMYAPVDHFLLSGPFDRHYTIDRMTGRLSFGNGQQGKKPPRLGEDDVRVHYAYGGGKHGNVPAGTITSLQSSVAFIDGVLNPEPAAGGCDAGTVEEAVVRGPKLFKHRYRAVTEEDFEWLTREAHPNVAKVKCLANLNVKLEAEPGAVSIVVLPKAGVGDGAHFQEMKRQVEKELMRQAASNVSFPGSIQVIAPAVLEIGIQATLWVSNMDEVVPVEREAISKLDVFLDPIRGNTDGKGWEIGQHVHRSMFYSLLKSVGPVQHIPQLSLNVYKLDNGDRVEWNPNRIHEVIHGIVVPGLHRIVVEVNK